MSRFIILADASDELDEIEAYLSEEASPETARRFLDTAERTFTRLAKMPGMGRAWGSPHKELAGVRVFRLQRPFDKYLAFYRPAEDAIEILHVLHAARDLPAILEAPELKQGQQDPEWEARWKRLRAYGAKMMKEAGIKSEEELLDVLYEMRHGKPARPKGAGRNGKRRPAKKKP